MAERLFMEQGATTMPAVKNDPEAIGAPMSPLSCTKLARASISSTWNPVSSLMTLRVDSVMTRWDSMPDRRRVSSRRTPYTVPEAPDMPTIRGFTCPPLRGGRRSTDPTGAHTQKDGSPHRLACAPQHLGGARGGALRDA